MINQHYRQARFLISAAKPAQFPDGGAEVAFAGRSNAGKSSAINTLCDNRNLARTSKTPGRTQLVNFFSLDDRRRLVDLPGYGFARVPLATREAWQRLMTAYLSEQPALQGLVLIMDIRHPVNDYDWQMLQWCEHYGLPVHILLTKADKLKRNAQQQSLLAVRRQLEQRQLGASSQLFSALKKTGMTPLVEKLDAWLDWPPVDFRPKKRPDR